MEIHTVLMYVIFGLFSIISYFAKGKLDDMKDSMTSFALKLDNHIKDDNSMNMKILEVYVTKAEYSETVGRMFDMLQSISSDIKNLISTKADKSHGS